MADSKKITEVKLWFDEFKELLSTESFKDATCDINSMKVGKVEVFVAQANIGEYSVSTLMNMFEKLTEDISSGNGCLYEIRWTENGKTFVHNSDEAKFDYSEMFSGNSIILNKEILIRVLVY